MLTSPSDWSKHEVKDSCEVWTNPSATHTTAPLLPHYVRTVSALDLRIQLKQGRRGRKSKFSSTEIKHADSKVHHLATSKAGPYKGTAAGLTLGTHTALAPAGLQSEAHASAQVKIAAPAALVHIPGRPDQLLPRGWTVTTKRKRISGPTEAGQPEFRAVHHIRSPEGQVFKTYGKARRHWRERGQRVRAGKQAATPVAPELEGSGLPAGWTAVRKRSLEANHPQHSYKVTLLKTSHLFQCSQATHRMLRGCVVQAPDGRTFATLEQAQRYAARMAAPAEALGVATLPEVEPLDLLTRLRTCARFCGSKGRYMTPAFSSSMALLRQHLASVRAQVDTVY